MSLISDLASALGVPAGGATLASAIYAGCIAAEKAAKSDSLRDISDAINNTNWASNISLPSAIYRIFVYTFGEKHFSFNCFMRSLTATVCFESAIIIQYLLITKNTEAFSYMTAEGIIVALIASIFAGYIALLKTRLLLSYADKINLPMLSVVLIDLLLSYLIVHISIDLFFTIYELYKDGIPSPFSSYIYFLLTAPTSMFYGAYVALAHKSEGISPSGIMLLSTLTTSVWIIAILVSSMTIKTVLPVQRFASWIYPVDEHPIQAIGFAAAGLIMIASVVWALIKPLFG